MKMYKKIIAAASAFMIAASAFTALAAEELVDSLSDVKPGETVTIKITEGKLIKIYTDKGDALEITPVEGKDGYYSFVMPSSDVKVSAVFANSTSAAAASVTIKNPMPGVKYSLYSANGTLIKEIEVPEEGAPADIVFSGLSANTAYTIRIFEREESAGTGSAPVYKTEPLYEDQVRTSAGSPAGGGGGGGGAAPATSYTITVEQTEGGTITPGTMTALRSSTKTFTITPDSGYELKDVLVNGVSVGALTTYRLEKIKGDTTIKAVFENPNAPKETPLPIEELDKENHIAFINGYEDGSFKPDGEITRAEILAMFARVYKTYNESETYSSDFDDVKGGSWYADTVGFMQDKGIINGYEDGTFRPEGKITRAEFAAVVSRFMGYKTGNADYEDVSPDHWAKQYIAAAAENGLIQGRDDVSFEPDVNLTRAEAVKTICLMLDREIDAQALSGVKDYTVFSDVAADNEYYCYIEEAANTHEYTKENDKEVWTALK